MDIPLLVAVTGGEEAALVASAEAARGLVVARRCADVAELLAAACAGVGRVALLSSDHRRLDRDLLSQLRAARVAVLGILPADVRRTGAGSAASATAAEALARFTALGVTALAGADAEPAALREAVQLALGDGAPGEPPPDAGEPDGVQALAPARAGRLVAVWGTAGAPGRTTVATTLAGELAARGASVLLADVDTWAASTAQVLGLLDEAAGIAAACRACAAGTLTPARLVELAPLVLPRLRVLTGLPRAERWPELGASALEGVWETARAVADWVVADCAAPIEADEELAVDVAAPRRNAATLAALRDADVVLVVGSADPIGLQRLVRALGDLAETLPAAPVRVVVTKVRSSAVGASPHRAVREALARFAGVTDVVLVPDDRAACDAALLAGRTLTEAAPSSPARAALADLARGLVGETSRETAGEPVGGGDAWAAGAPGHPGARAARRGAPGPERGEPCASTSPRRRRRWLVR